MQLFSFRYSLTKILERDEALGSMRSCAIDFELYFLVYACRTHIQLVNCTHIKCESRR